MATTSQTVQKLYIAYFGRPADPAGATNAAKLVDWAGSPDALLVDFGKSAEYTSQFAGLTSAQIVNTIYNNLFGRNAEATGLNFWAAKVDSGEIPLSTATWTILSGVTAGSVDDIAVNSKVSYAESFTAKLATDAAAAVAYNASTLAMVKAELAKIVDATTLAAETASLDTFVSSVAKTGADAGVPGQTFTLTDAIGEDVVGTAGNDTYKAVLDGDTDTGDQGTLNLSDAIADIGGTDTLNLVVVDSDATTAQTAALKAGSTIDGVEIVNLLQAGTTLTAVDTDDFGGVKQLWQVDGVSGAAIDVGAGVTIGFRDVAVAAADAVTAKDGVTSLTVALDNVTDNSVINLDETTANDVTTATVTGSVDTAVAGTNRLTLDDTGALGALDTLNVSLTSNTTVTVDANVAANLETLNFGGSTGGLTVTVVKADFDAAGTAVTFGSGTTT